MRTRTRKPKTSRAHGTGSTGSYGPATCVTIQPVDDIDKGEILYKTVIPESCTLPKESFYWHFDDSEDGRDDATRAILQIPEVRKLVGSTPGLVLVVQYGFVYAGGWFERSHDYVAFDPLTPSRLKELFDEDWDDC